MNGKEAAINGKQELSRSSREAEPALVGEVLARGNMQSRAMCQAGNRQRLPAGA